MNTTPQSLPIHPPPQPRPWEWSIAEAWTWFSQVWATVSHTPYLGLLSLLLAAFLAVAAISKVLSGR